MRVDTQLKLDDMKENNYNKNKPCCFVVVQQSDITRSTLNERLTTTLSQVIKGFIIYTQRRYKNGGRKSS